MTIIIIEKMLSHGFNKSSIFIELLKHQYSSEGL
jgi:hypothetical protein